MWLSLDSKGAWPRAWEYVFLISIYILAKPALLEVTQVSVLLCVLYYPGVECLCVCRVCPVLGRWGEKWKGIEGSKAVMRLRGLGGDRVGESGQWSNGNGQTHHSGFLTHLSGTRAVASCVPQIPFLLNISHRQRRGYISLLFTLLIHHCIYSESQFIFF